MIIGITDSTLFDSWESFRKRVLELLNSEIDFLILREKSLDADDLIAFLLDLMSESDNTCKKIIVHSQVAAARHLGLTYVHLPEERIEEERKSHTSYSYSTHSSKGVKKVKTGDLFTMISPVFKTTCKKDEDPLDSQELLMALSVPDKNLVALGGITLDNALSLKELGFKSIALRSSIMLSENPHELIKLYKEMGF